MFQFNSNSGKLRKIAMAAVVVFFGISFSANGQNITVNLNNTSLKSVLNEIQKQINYSFIYDDDLIGASKTVSVSINNESLASALGKVLTPNNIEWTIIGRQIALAPKKAPVNKSFTLKGRVIDQEGEPIPGATIRNQKDNSFAVTDVEGYYTLFIKDPDDVKLEYSFMGMNAIVEPLNGRQNLNMVMTASRLFLDEAVVTGYQEIQQKKVTGAIATVSASKIEERFTPNIMNNLEGRVAGLSTYGGKLTIRGVSSIYAEASPLVVVDGLPIEGSIDDINPYDIESVNVLKDAAAAAIYGARASNGIIVITTKNARKKGKIDVTFTSNVSIYEKQNVDYNDNWYMNAEQQVEKNSEYYDYIYFNGGSTDPIGGFEQSVMRGYNDIFPLEYAYYRAAKGEISKSELENVKSKLSKNNFAQEYADQIYRRHVLQSYNLAIRSRAENLSNNFIINYKHDNSGIINTFDRQINVNYKGSYDIFKWLTATASINGIYENGRTKGSDYNGIDSPWTVPAFESMYEEDGSDRLFYSWYNGNRYWDGFDKEGIVDQGINIRDEYYNNTIDTRRTYLRYHGDLLFKIFKGFTANAQFVYESNHTTSDWMANDKSHAVRTMKNALAYQDPKTGAVAYYCPASGGIRSQKNVDGSYWTARAQANYSNKFGKHEIAAIAGMEFRETLYSGTRSLMLGYDDQLQNASTQVVDFKTISDMRYGSGYFMPLSGGYPVSQFVYDPYISSNMSPIMEQHHRYASAYFNATYSYDERYNVFGSYRKDYADVYGLNVTLRGRPLWSVGAAWNINNEDFMKGCGWLDALKLRVSYGETGNIYQNATSYMTAAVKGLQYYTQETYAEVESPANPNLKWERTKTINLGVDYSILDNRFRGALDYYRKAGLDLFSNKALDPTTGFTTMFMNSANMINNGVELSLTADWLRPNSQKSFGWSTSFTFSYNKNRITAIENASTRAYELISYTPYKVGYPSSAVWSYEFAGIDDGTIFMPGAMLMYGENRQLTHGASTASTDILVYSGQSEPKTIMGLDNRFTWNGLSLNVLMAYYSGHVARMNAETETFNVNPAAESLYRYYSWTPENPTDHPGYGQYGSNAIGSEPSYADKFVYSAAFLKIRNIVLGYELPRKWLEPIGLERANLQIQIDNPKPLWLANPLGMDPETMGVRTPSTFIFGVNINF